MEIQCGEDPNEDRGKILDERIEKQASVKKSIQIVIDKLNTAINIYNLSDHSQPKKDDLIKAFTNCATTIGKKTKMFHCAYSEYDYNSGSFKQNRNMGGSNSAKLIQMFFESLIPIDNTILDDENFVTAFSTFIFSIWQPFGKITLYLSDFCPFLVDQINRITRPNYMIELREDTNYTRGRAIQPTVPYGNFQTKLMLFNTVSKDDDFMDIDGIDKVLAEKLKQLAEADAPVIDAMQQQNQDDNQIMGAVAAGYQDPGQGPQDGGNLKVYATNKRNYLSLTR